MLLQKWKRGVSFVDDIGLLKIRDAHRAVVEYLATAPVLVEGAADFMDCRRSEIILTKPLR